MDLPSETTPPNNAGSLISYKFSFVYSNFDDADTSETVQFFTLPAGAHILAANIKGTTQFAGPSLTNATGTLIVGGNTLGNPCATLGDAPSDANQSSMANAAAGTFSSLFSDAAEAVSFKLDTAGCNINALTAGAFDVILTYTVPAVYPVVIA